MERIALPVVAGPTACGKTALAVELARRLDGEVVSADSMQIYAGLSIGTARPSPNEMKGVPHHLMGFLPLTESYSVARYVEDAGRVIREISSRGKKPIVCGGTGLYVSSLIDNLDFTGDGESSSLREQLMERARSEGGRPLLQELTEVDPQTAARLHEHDIVRIVRALELYLSTGVTMSEQLRRSRVTPSPYDACVLFLTCRDRDWLYDRINRRVDAMLEAGLLEETQELLRCPGVPTAIQAIGYKELFPYLAGELTLAQAAENLKRSTRRYAKRQLTWFRRRADTIPVYADEYDDAEQMCDQAMQLLNEHYRW